MGDPDLIHPALFFDPTRGIASVGVFDSKGEPFLVIMEDGKARRLDTFSNVHPAPMKYPPLAGRWDPKDVDAFLREPTDGGDFHSVLYITQWYLERFIEFVEPAHSTLVACWVIATYFYPLFPAFPRLAIHGERQSGKSKLLGLISEMAFNGLHRVNQTPAGLFRLIEPLRPTFCLDEMEGLRGGKHDDLMSLLNAGYKAGGAVDRVEERQNKWIVVPYSIYAPVAIGSITECGPTLRDRAIVLRMLRGADRDTVNRSLWPNDPLVRIIRNAAYRLALTRWRDVRQSWDQQYIPPGLVGRNRELYRPLLTIAQLADADPEPEPSTTTRLLIESLGLSIPEDWAPEPREPFETAHEVLWVAASELGDRESLPEEARALFAELADKLQSADSITVRPGELVPAVRVALNLLVDSKGGWDHPTAADIGSHLSRFGFEKKRGGGGVHYTVTREVFLDRAKRYGYPAGV
jgi:hypothetical protein